MWKTIKVPLYSKFYEYKGLRIPIYTLRIIEKITGRDKKSITKSRKELLKKIHNEVENRKRLIQDYIKEGELIIVIAQDIEIEKNTNYLVGICKFGVGGLK